MITETWSYIFRWSSFCRWIWFTFSCCPSLWTNSPRCSYRFSFDFVGYVCKYHANSVREGLTHFSESLGFIQIFVRSVIHNDISWLVDCTDQTVVKCSPGHKWNFLITDRLGKPLKHPMTRTQHKVEFLARNMSYKFICHKFRKTKIYKSTMVRNILDHSITRSSLK